MRKGIKVKQRDLTDCGAACLASVAAWYRLRLPVSRIRQFAGTDRRGTNVLGLIEASEALGFQAKGAKGTTDSLYKIPLPAIAHIRQPNGAYHFVVIYKARDKGLLIMDPADGQLHKRTVDAFCEVWAGVFVLLLPGEGFTSGKLTTRPAQRFLQLIRPCRAMMIQAFIGAVLYTVLGLSTSIYVQKIVDFVLLDSNRRLLNLLSLVMIALTVFQVIIGTVKSVIGLQTGQHIDARLILGYYKHLLRLPQRFFDTMRVGEIISRVNDAVKIRMFVNDVAMGMLVNVLIIGFSISIMFMYYWKLAAIMLAILPLYTALYLIGNKINKKWQRQLMEKSADLETQLVESINSVATIKRFGLEEHSNFRTEGRFIGLLRSIYAGGIRNLYLGASSEFVTRIFTIVILWVGGHYVIARELSPGELMSFYALVGYFTGPASSLIGANRSIQDALIAADRLFEIIDLETEKSDAHTVDLKPELVGDIRFNEVHFRYGTRGNVFKGLNLTIRKNRVTAIVGESGSGKSTLLSLMQNLYPLKDGSISIGGIDIRHISNTSLRNRVSVVPQHIDLFAGTVVENIAIGDPQPDMHRVLALSHLLGIHEFIEKLPDTYNTVLSEQAVNLSGGQRQRLAIARALYRAPEILILDEATSNLDPVSEQKVQDAIQWYRRQDKTIIIIAHRLSTIRHADTIILLKDGKLAEEGDHGELITHKGNYYSMWQEYTGGV